MHRVSDHPLSFESDAWTRAGKASELPVCIMNAGYSSGWCEESFGVPLVATEIMCRAKGDEVCRFVMAHPSQIASRISDYVSGEPALAGKVTRYEIPRLFNRKKLEEDLRRSNLDLQQFAHAVSHDLQAPLRTIKGFARLLERKYQGQLDREADEYLGFITDGVQWMDTLLDDMLSFSRVSTEGVVQQDVQCEEALTQALKNLRAAIQDSGASVTHDPLPAVRADGPQLVQLLQNLLGNAIKFCGEQPPQIHVSARRGPGEWVLSVQDHGIGLAPEDAARVFEMFQRLHTRERYAGSGIGLAVCNRIVERHGGRIWIEASPGAGATVHFALPGG